MKTSLFITNTISGIFLLNILIKQPSITGFAVAPPTSELTLISPLGLASAFIITTLVLDIYCYIKSRK